MGGFRNGCFTVFQSDTTVSDIDAWYDEFAVCDLPRGITYLVYQKELCPESKREHIQGYAEASCQKTLSAWQKCLKIGNSHIKARFATAVDAAKYCTDKGVHRNTGLPKILGVDILKPHVERGEMSEQGKRKDLETICEEIKAGASMQEVAMNHPAQFVRYHKGFQAYESICFDPPARPDYHCYFLYGRAGCGKSTWARRTFPDAYFAKDTPQAWMQRYKGQKAIIFDEFMGHTPVGEMNNLIDKTPLTFNVKGADAICKAETIVITTNKRWSDMYGDAVGGVNPGWKRRMEDPRITTHIHEDDPVLRQAIADELGTGASTQAQLTGSGSQVIEVILCSITVYFLEQVSDDSNGIPLEEAALPSVGPPPLAPFRGGDFSTIT